MPRSPRRERTLSEDELIEVALRMIRYKGAAGLSMRDLAKELDVSAMAAYYYVSSKDELLRLVANHVWGSVKIPASDAGPWHERLRTVLLSERQATAPYRGLYEAVMSLDVEHKRALEDTVLDLLLDAGYPTEKAVPAFRVLMSWVNGFSDVESALRDPERRRPSGWGKAQRLAQDRGQMPEMSAEEYFTFGLDVVIAGLRTKLDT